MSKKIAVLGDSCKLFPNTPNEVIGTVTQASVITSEGKNIVFNGCFVAYVCPVHKAPEIGTLVSSSIHKVPEGNIVVDGDKVTYCSGSDGEVIATSNNKA